MSNIQHLLRNLSAISRIITEKQKCVGRENIISLFSFILTDSLSGLIAKKVEILKPPAQTTADGKDLSWAKCSLLKVALLHETISGEQSIRKGASCLSDTFL